MLGPQLLNDGAHLAGGGIDDDDVTISQVVPATCLHDAVDSDVSGLDGDARLCAVLHHARQLEELAEPDASGH